MADSLTATDIEFKKVGQMVKDSPELARGSLADAYRAQFVQNHIHRGDKLSGVLLKGYWSGVII